MIRKVLAGLGLLVAVVGFAMVFDPGLAAQLSLTEKVLLFVAVAGGIQTYRVVRGRMRTDVEAAETPDAETEQDLPVPGEGFDETVGELKSAGHGESYRAANRSYRDNVVRDRERIRARLEEAAVTTIQHKWGVPEERAREALSAGTWTDDPHAAAFFTGELEGVRVTQRVFNALAADARFQRRARRAAVAIDELANGDGPSPPNAADRGERREVVAQ